MWIATNIGFISIVQSAQRDYARYLDEVSPAIAAELPNDAKFVLCIRGRSAADLAAVVNTHNAYTDASVRSRIVEWPGRDYPARIFLKRDVVATMIAANIRGIVYSNFKDSVKSNALHDAYMAVWSAMNKYGRGGFGRLTEFVKPALRRPNGKADRAARKALPIEPDMLADMEHDNQFGHNDLRAR